MVHGARTRAKRVRRRVGGGQHLRMVRQRQVAVAVHPQKVALAGMGAGSVVPSEPEAGT